DVGVLADGTAARRARREVGPRDVDGAVRLAVPGGDPVPPPELARDTPGPDVLHPVVVRLGPRARDDPRAPLAHGLHRLRRQRLDPDVPLLGDERLHDRLAAVADADGVAIGLDPLDEAARLHVLDDPLPRLEAVEPCVPSGLRGHLPVEPDHGPDGQVVAPPDLEVDRVVAGRHLDDAGAEARVDGLVGHHADRDRPVDGFDLELAADVAGVALVLRVHGEAGVAELRLRAHGAEREGSVLDVDELRVALLALHLEVGEHGLAARAPVDDVVVAVDQAFLVEP